MSYTDKIIIIFQKLFDTKKFFLLGYTYPAFTMKIRKTGPLNMTKEKNTNVDSLNTCMFR